MVHVLDTQIFVSAVGLKTALPSQLVIPGQCFVLSELPGVLFPGDAMFEDAPAAGPTIMLCAGSPYPSAFLLNTKVVSAVSGVTRAKHPSRWLRSP